MASFATGLSAWFAHNGSTIAVLLVLLVVVGAILRNMIKNKTLSCDGCSGDCAGCGGVCPSATLELSAEQQAELEAFRQRRDDCLEGCSEDRLEGWLEDIS